MLTEDSLATDSPELMLEWLQGKDGQSILKGLENMWLNTMREIQTITAECHFTPFNWDEGNASLG